MNLELHELFLQEQCEKQFSNLLLSYWATFRY